MRKKRKKEYIYIYPLYTYIQRVYRIFLLLPFKKPTPPNMICIIKFRIKKIHNRFQTKPPTPCCPRFLHLLPPFLCLVPFLFFFLYLLFVFLFFFLFLPLPTPLFPSRERFFRCLGGGGGFLFLFPPPFPSQVTNRTFCGPF